MLLTLWLTLFLLLIVFDVNNVDIDGDDAIDMASDDIVDIDGDDVVDIVAKMLPRL